MSFLGRVGLLAIVTAALAVAWATPPPIVYDVQNYPVVAASSTAGVAITFDPSQPYGIYHTGKNASGVAATGLVVIGYGANPATADYAAESNKLILESSGTVMIDRGVTTLYIKSASGAPMLQIVPRAPVR